MSADKLSMFLSMLNPGAQVILNCMKCGQLGNNFISVYAIAASSVYFFSQKYDFSLLTNSRRFHLSSPFDLDCC